MSDLPEMLRGAIALEYHETVHTALMSDKDNEKYEERSDSHAPCDSCPPCAETLNGPTCDGGCKSGDPLVCPDNKTTFEPAVAAWSAPPPLPGAYA
jgi:hypothetical protein